MPKCIAETDDESRDDEYYDQVNKKADELSSRPPYSCKNQIRTSQKAGNA